MDLPAEPGRAGLNWLLHRAAQKLGAVAQEAAGRHGVTTRGQLVLTAPAGGGARRTQLALGHSLGLDKTTLTAELDRVEREFTAEPAPAEVHALHGLLRRVIAADHRPDSGSCL